MPLAVPPLPPAAPRTGTSQKPQLQSSLLLLLLMFPRRLLQHRVILPLVTVELPSSRPLSRRVADTLVDLSADPQDSSL